LAGLAVGGLDELANTGGGGGSTATATATATITATATATASISGAGSTDMDEATKHDVSAAATLGAAGEAARGTIGPGRRDVGAYAFALVEKVLRSSPDGYLFSEVVGWEKAVLAPLHTAHVRNAPVIDQHPVLRADQDVGPEFLKRQYHPRISAAVSMLHAVLWERFKTVTVCYHGNRCSWCACACDRVRVAPCALLVLAPVHVVVHVAPRVPIPLCHVVAFNTAMVTVKHVLRPTSDAALTRT
jgi:hypothetical protein